MCWSISANLRKTAYLSVDKVRGLALPIPGRWAGYLLFHFGFDDDSALRSMQKSADPPHEQNGDNRHSERPSAHRTLVLRCRTRRNDAVPPLCHCAGC